MGVVMFARLRMPEDEDAVIELARAQVAETVSHLGFDDAIARSTFHLAMTTANPTIFVVEENRVVVGFLMALINPYAFTTGFFTSQEVIYVRPDRRRTRASALLVEMFNDWSDRLGPKEVFAGVANGLQVANTTRFFKRFGFDVVGTYLRRIVPNGKGR